MGESISTGVACDDRRKTCSFPLCRPGLALGEDAAADMMSWMQGVETNRAGLRELNDLVAARLEGRIDRVQSEVGRDLARTREELRGEMATLREGLRGEMATLREDLRGEMSTLREETRVGFAMVQSKIDARFAESIKWSFLFWLGVVAALAIKG